MKTHVLKCEPDQFEHLRSGRKNFEWRKDDRGYGIGDTLILRRFDNVRGDFTGEFLVRQIEHILRKGYGMPRGFAVLGLRIADVGIVADPFFGFSAGRLVMPRLSDEDTATLKELLKSGWRNTVIRTPESQQREDIYYAVIEPSGNEGVLFKDRNDAEWTATGHGETWGVPTVGEAFRNVYAGDGALSVLPVFVRKHSAADGGRTK